MRQDGSTLSVLSADRRSSSLRAESFEPRDSVFAVYLRFVEFVRRNLRNGFPPSATSMIDEILAERISEYADTESKANEHA